MVSRPCTWADASDTTLSQRLPDEQQPNGSSLCGNLSRVTPAQIDATECRDISRHWRRVLVPLARHWWVHDDPVMPAGPGDPFGVGQRRLGRRIEPTERWVVH
jgi:hypothetical protein